MQRVEPDYRRERCKPLREVMEMSMRGIGGRTRLSCLVFAPVRVSPCDVAPSGSLRDLQLTIRRGLPILVLLAMAVPAAAQVQIEKSRPAPAAGRVGIENSFGTVKVIGWDKNEVTVTGRLAPGAEQLDLSGDKESVWIDVDTPESWLYDSDDDTEYRTQLEIRVPLKSTLDVETLNASVTIENVSGEIDVTTVNGSITISGSPATVEVETMTGAVTVGAQSAEMAVSTVSGKVTLKGATRRVGVETVSGAVEVQGHSLDEAEIETTAGDVRFEGTLGREGSFSIETFSGNVELVLALETAARFHLVTFNGQILNDRGPKPRRDGRFNPYQEARFTTGLNDYEVSVNTYSGNIKLRAAGAPAAAPAASPPRP